MANGYGGARKGAGRPKGSVTALEHAMKQAKARAITTVADKVQEFLEDNLLGNLNNLESLANGIQVNEGEEVFAVPPDRQSNIYLIDRYLGKPTERTEARGEVVIRIVYEKRPRIVDGKVHEEGT